MANRRIIKEVSIPHRYGSYNIALAPLSQIAMALLCRFLIGTVLTFIDFDGTAAEFVSIPHRYGSYVTTLTIQKAAAISCRFLIGTVLTGKRLSDSLSLS